MPILDISAGRGALANVNNATNALINARNARTQGFTNSLLQFNQIVSNYQNYKNNEEMRALQKQGLERDIINKDLSNIQKGTSNNLLEKEYESYDKNQALKEKQIHSNINAQKASMANAYANAARTNIETQKEKDFLNWLKKYDEPVKKQEINFFDILHKKS
ncbi:hypothetical protein [Campylobacter sp. VTCC 70190]|uniref:hypothetical protein n=1 Tax=Campylobacter sp. VTCC 70190 TaxID=3392118 RepID=UPI00398F29AF